MDILTQKSLLVSLISPLVNLPEVSISSTVEGQTVGFGGRICALHWGKDDAFILVDVDYGYQFGVTLNNLKIEVVKTD